MSGALFHALTPWVPTPANVDDDCTPGRVGHVFFFPERSYNALHDKKNGWSKQTNGGLVTVSE